jgi:hypothetical protein
MFDPTKNRLEPAKSNEESQQKLAIRSTSNSPSNALPTTAGEQQAYEFFTRKTAELISVYSCHHFWTVLLPQATHQHLAVKHSVVALAILHQSLAEDGHLSEDNNDRLFLHYNTAIRAITQGQPSVDIVLMTCILFWAIENFNSYGCRAHDHIDAAMKILDEFKSKEENKTSPHYEVISQHIEPALRAAHLHLNYNRDVPSRFTGMIDSHGILAEGLPHAFTTLEQAAEHLRLCIRCLLKVMNDSGADTMLVRADLAVIEAHLSRWLGLFHSLTAKAKPEVRRMLVVHHVTASVSFSQLRHQTGGQERDEARLKRRCAWIIDEMEDTLSQPASITAGEGSSSDPASELGLIPPLFVVAVLSQDDGLTKQALSMLRGMNGVEGHWASDAAATIAEGLVSMGEGEALDIKIQELAIHFGHAGLQMSRLQSGVLAQCSLSGTLEEVEEADLVNYESTIRKRRMLTKC